MFTYICILTYLADINFLKLVVQGVTRDPLILEGGPDYYFECTGIPARASPSETLGDVTSQRVEKTFIQPKLQTEHVDRLGDQSALFFSFRATPVGPGGDGKGYESDS